MTLQAAVFLLLLPVSPAPGTQGDRDAGDGTARVHGAPFAIPSCIGAARLHVARHVTFTLTPSRLCVACLFTPSRLRVALLFRGGEFSTFRRRTPPIAGLPIETAQRTPPLDRRVEDRWIAGDKAKHVAFSFLWTLSTQYTAVNKGGLSEHRALPISIGTSALVGVTKEYYDLQVGPTRHFSVRDLVADAVGIVLAAGFILL